MTQTSPDQTPEALLASLGLALPTPPKPVAAYIPFRRTGNLIYTAGQIAFSEGKLLAIGAVPSQVSVETAQACARQCALNALAVLKSAVGDLSAVKQVVRVGVFVCSDPGFYDQPKIANAASEPKVLNRCMAASFSAQRELQATRARRPCRPRRVAKPHP